MRALSAVAAAPRCFRGSQSSLSVARTTGIRCATGLCLCFSLKFTCVFVSVCQLFPQKSLVYHQREKMNIADFDSICRYCSIATPLDLGLFAIRVLLLWSTATIVEDIKMEQEESSSIAYRIAYFCLCHTLAAITGVICFRYFHVEIVNHTVSTWRLRFKPLAVYIALPFVYLMLLRSNVWSFNAFAVLLPLPTLWYSDLRPSTPMWTPSEANEIIRELNRGFSVQCRGSSIEHLFLHSAKGTLTTYFLTHASKVPPDHCTENDYLSAIRAMAQYVAFQMYVCSDTTTQPHSVDEILQRNRDAIQAALESVKRDTLCCGSSRNMCKDQQ